MSGNSIFAPLDVDVLSGKGLMGPVTPLGTRLLHKRRLNRSSDEENSDIPLDISFESTNVDEAFVAIPDKLISSAALEYVGFSQVKAQQIFDNWVSWPPGLVSRETDPDDGGLQMTFIDYITGVFDTSINVPNDTASEDDEEWTRCLNHYGLSLDTRAAIMDRRFKHLRLTESCTFWAKDTVMMRYAGLGDVQETSRERQMAIQRATSRPGSSNTGGTSSVAEATSAQPSRRSISGMQQEHAPGIFKDSSSSAAAIAAYNAPGHLILFRGVDQARIKGLIGDDGRLSNIQDIISRAPSDFSGTRLKYYFTNDIKVAEYYAAFPKRRSNCESVVIVCIQIPNNAIESLQEPDIQRIYWPSPEWKEFVWHSRTNKRQPKKFNKYQEATLIIGSTAKKPNLEFHKLSSWESVSEKYLLKLRSSDPIAGAIQYVFSDSKGGDFLEESIEDRVKIFPFKGRELEDWLTRGDFD